MKKEQPINITYYELREISKEKALELVRKVLVNMQENLSEMAWILNIARKKVRRTRDGTLSDYPRRPKSSPNKIDSHFEDFIVTEVRHTSYGAKQLSSFLFQKYVYEFSMDTIKRY